MDASAEKKSNMFAPADPPGSLSGGRTAAPREFSVAARNKDRQTAQARRQLEQEWQSAGRTKRIKALYIAGRKNRLAN